MTGPVMRRADRKNTLGKSIDTICGYQGEKRIRRRHWR